MKLTVYALKRGNDILCKKGGGPRVYSTLTHAKIALTYFAQEDKNFDYRRCFDGYDVTYDRATHTYDYSAYNGRIDYCKSQERPLDEYKQAYEIVELGS